MPDTSLRHCESLTLWTISVSWFLWCRSELRDLASETPGLFLVKGSPDNQVTVYFIIMN
jgi:hypothetical protein